MDKSSYALGMSIAHNMISSGIREVEFDDFTAGLKAVLAGEKPAVSFEEAAKLLDKYFAELEQKQKSEAAAMGAAMKKEGEDFLRQMPVKKVSSPCRAVCSTRWSLPAQDAGRARRTGSGAIIAGLSWTGRSSTAPTTGRNLPCSG